MEELNELVRQTFSQVQDSLGKIEKAAQVDDRPSFQVFTRAYARLLSPLRDYVASVNMGRPLPRQLAKRVAEAADAIFERADDARALGLQPDAVGLTQLIRAAETAT